MGLLIAFSAAILAMIIYTIFKSRNKELMEEEPNDSAIESTASASGEASER
jgi:biopolymer transport protein ExbB/TolQ